MPLLDTLNRPLQTLRLSVTDRCNLRCEYCMPEDEYVWLSRENLLTFAEYERVVAACTSLGVNKVRLTGGEPLLRSHLDDLIRNLAALDGVSEIALTTNGVLLADQLDALARAGLTRVTISLDTLRPDRFVALTRQNRLETVLAAIDAACRRFDGTKIDAVIMRGVNDDEIGALLELGTRVGAEVRFIEYMDVGGATHWRPDLVMSSADVVAHIAARYGVVEAVPEPDSTAPARRHRLSDGRVFGIVASTTDPFCRTCDRARITADGLFYTCLYATDGFDLRAPLRSGASDEDLRALVAARWVGRSDRGAEVRRDLRDRSVSVPLTALRADPHLEMHKRGG